MPRPSTCIQYASRAPSYATGGPPYTLVFVLKVSISAVETTSRPAGVIGAGGGIRTHEPLRDGSLSPTPLTMLGDPRARAGRLREF